MQIDPNALRTGAEAGAYVRRARRAIGLRQADLAVAAGVSVRTVHNVEEGKSNVKLATLLRVLDALGLALEVSPKRRRLTPPVSPEDDE
jgi:y4mF family transcriptional regulator